MANGTIAFDTLSTSGQISGTAKSVDTDYLASGSAKCWIQFNGSGTIATNDSFNVSGITDRGTGIYTVTIANDMANDDYSVSGSGEVNFGTYRTYLCVDIDEGGQETAEVNINCGNTDSQIDAVTQFMTLHGDLA